MNNDAEIWLPISVEGFEHIYSISNQGRVRREIASGRYLAGHILKMQINNGGYHVVGLRKPNIPRKWITVHLLVALAFVGCPLQRNKQWEVYLHINHKDGNKLNNHPLNLEWVTPQENRDHAVAIGLDDRKGEKHHFAKFTEWDIKYIRNQASNGCRLQILADKYGVHVEYIRLIVKRKRWKHIA
ncbi:MAG: NUMOD4 domain-containing protein [Nostoc sp. ChiSLP01]|nr:NUMOD4 domain-containing protein [Nostoc sp. CmiSLP01]MDZ8285258.1 NUMOD4 domain-containing protein [Nostoc sp. ChiSLP01]